MWYLLEAFQVMEQEPERCRGRGGQGISEMIGMGEASEMDTKMDAVPVCREHLGRIEGQTMGRNGGDPCQNVLECILKTFYMVGSEGIQSNRSLCGP